MKQLKCSFKKDGMGYLIALPFVMAAAYTGHDWPLLVGIVVGSLILAYSHSLASLTIRQRPALNHSIVGAQELGCKYIIMDFAKVTGLDAIILRHLFMWYHKMQPHHVEISIVNPSTANPNGFGTESYC